MRGWCAGLLVFLLVACLPGPPPAAPLAATGLASPTALVLAPSATPPAPRTRRSSSTVTYTATPYRTRTPRPTSTLVPPILTDPNPTIHELLLVLIANHSSKWYVDLERLQGFEAEVHEKADLDGDGQQEILLAGGGMYIDLVPFFAIFTYKPTGWEEQFYLEWGGKTVAVRTRLLASRLQVEFVSHTTAGGLNAISWHQFWIRCEAGRCWELWSAEVYSDFWTGLGPTQYYRLATIDEPTPGTMRRLVRSLSIPLPPDWHLTPTPSGVPLIEPEVVETYAWDGERYTLSTQEHLVPSVSGAAYLADLHRCRDELVAHTFTRPDGSVDEDAFYVLGLSPP